jgi:biotin carboxyl carrier protein
MKRYRITVDGQTYDVTVEEAQGGTSPASGPTVAQTAQEAGAAATQAAPQQTVRPSAANASGGTSLQVSAPAAVTAKKTALTIKAPMPGVVMSFKVAVGQQIKKGDVVLILEAMKMENEIVSPQDGTVLMLHVPEGASVNTGDSLVDLG